MFQSVKVVFRKLKPEYQPIYTVRIKIPLDSEWCEPLVVAGLFTYLEDVFDRSLNRTGYSRRSIHCHIHGESHTLEPKRVLLEILQQSGRSFVRVRSMLAKETLNDSQNWLSALQTLLEYCIAITQ